MQLMLYLQIEMEMDVEMVNKTILLLIGMFVVPFCFAFQEYQMITQTQLDNYPIENLTLGEIANALNYQDYGGIRVYVYGEWIYVRSMSILNLERINETHLYFKRIRVIPPPVIHQYEWIRCKEEHTYQECLSIGWNYLVNQFQGYIEMLRQQIIDLKTPPDYGDFGDFSGEWY